MSRAKPTSEKEARLLKLAQLRKQGVEIYPAKTGRAHSSREALEDSAAIIKKQTPLSVAGRIVGWRAHGSSIFAHLYDGEVKLQVYFKKDELGAESFKNLSLLDLGDFMEAAGILFKTKTGELTVLVKKWAILGKSLSPLPEKWHGLQDKEARFRRRELDILSNHETREIFLKRSVIIKAVRAFLDERGYLEVETPVLQPLAGGASARPFATHHNSLDLDLYLRVAPELYLKRLLVAGFPKVYEIARCFRNEGIDWAHNPEFTQVEFYQAYMDYEQLMDMTEDLLLSVLKGTRGKNEFDYDGRKIIFKKNLARLTFRSALVKYAKIDIEKYPDQASIYKKAKEMKLEDVGPNDGRGKICDELYKEFVRPNLIAPTFIIDHPVELSPLAKQKPSDPRYVERFQLVLGGGVELVNAFSELNDPLEQRKRFIEQQKLRDRGDEEAQPLDEDFLESLSYGLPPCAGFGMGIDRLTSLLCDKKNIKEVILFPLLRPKLTDANDAN